MLCTLAERDNLPGEVNIMGNSETTVNVPGAIVQFINAYNDMDVDAMMACLNDDAVFENVSNYHAAMSWEGIPAIRKLAEQSAAAFASRNQAILRCIQDETTVALEVQFTGVPLVDLPNGMKSGEPAVLNGVSFFELKDEKISKLRDFS